MKSAKATPIPEQVRFKSSMTFSNKIVEATIAEYSALLNFLDIFKKAYDEEVTKMPYHINLIDELHANENAHSRILEKLFSQQNTTTRNYEILESFLQFIIQKYHHKKDFHRIEIRKPRITQEKKRIDLWVRDHNNYAIVIENKVNNAKDQNEGKTVKGGQLERYINTTKEFYFKEEQIYILYLPPTYEKEPTKESWGKYYESEIHKNRYLNLSFKEDILPWLKNNVLPNIQTKDRYLSSAIEQYVDHLEGKFSLRTINNKMNMELQKFIINELGLNGIVPENALKIVLNKKEDMQNALNQLSELERKIKIEHFQEWEKQLKAHFPHCEIVGNWNKPNSTINIGVRVNCRNAFYSLLVEYNHSSIYYGIGRHYASLEKNETSYFDGIISDLNLHSPDDWWYAKENTSFQNAFLRLKTLIEETECKKQ
nr:PD-(D/E)XK nuclease family protein [uncultured Draconibacterium sp.]